jgi:glucosamine--fructose-6-phosphate aminotransferase (isomerizing)
MCGIIGYIGSEPASPILTEGLKRLEYRGYDSVGVATIDFDLHIKKGVGKITDLEKSVGLTDMPGTIGIAHTRWATHGGVSLENAHPQVSNDGRIAVVHNGVIENYQDLKRKLESDGFVFRSQTDTEVIPNLVQLNIRRGKSFREAVIAALSELEGYYAVAIVEKNGKEIAAARRGSPLVLGIGENGYFVASDIPAFIDYTKRVMFLYDEDVAFLSNNIEIYNISNKSRVERKVSSIDWDYEQAKKGNFDHFMMKEISEQVDTVKRAMQQDPETIKNLVRDIRNSRGVFFLGCGSSYNACLAASYIFSKVAKMHINVVLASEFPNYEHFLTDKTLVIAVSQSGETMDLLEAVRSAKSKGSKVVSITNVTGSSITRDSDRTVMTNAGPEISVLSTKSYTSQLAILTMLAHGVAGKIEEERRKLNHLWNTIYMLTSENTRNKIISLAQKLKDKREIFLIGRGLQYATALEAALKIKEVSYIHAEALAGGELKHGTIALIEEGTPCIVFISKDNEKESISNAMEVKSRGGYIVGVSSENNEVFDFWIKVPESGEHTPICQIIPMQILAYQLAVLKGLDPDHPRNLAKSVTVK